MSHKKHHKEHHDTPLTPSRKGRLLRHGLWWKLSIVAAVLIIFAIIGVAVLAYDLPTMEEIANHQAAQSTKIYDRTGKVLLYEAGGDTRRTVIPFNEIPQDMRDAIIAIEDERFYSEAAFDWRGIIRATLTNLRHGEIVEGASTITQQLARNAFALSPEQTITRKVREVIVAIRLSRHYTKDQVLELYLNEIPYGGTFYGIESAAQGYLGKSAKDLTLAESALLAAMPKAPSYYSPWGSHQDELFARQRTVLNKMVELEMISQAEADEASRAPIVFQPQAQGLKAPHFSLMIQEYLEEKYGADLVAKGGLKITSTLDWDLQQAAEKAVQEGAARNEELYKGKNAALVAQDPKTGQVLALVGSRDYFDVKNQGNFNVASQGLRQPGSSFKPFVYMSSFQKGYTPDTVVFDVPTEFTAGDPANCPAIFNPSQAVSGCFHPQNFDRAYRGPINLRTALAQSLNVPAVKVLYLTGMRDAIATAQNFGVSTLNDPTRYGLTLVLGGGEVKLIDMVGAYSVLAADGVKHDRALIMEVRDNRGNVLESFEDKYSEVVDPQYVRLTNSILTDLDARSGLFQSSLGLTTVPGYSVGFKTGTTNDSRDAWAFGYTPFLAAGVWAGNNDNAPMQARGTSLVAAVPIWNAFMKEAAKKYLPEHFPEPSPVSANKPMLNGQVWGEQGVHSILYYVDKGDPLGAYPDNPGRDPQFRNWEEAVQHWVQGNPLPPTGGNASSTDPNASTTIPIIPGTPTINLRSPQNGDFIQQNNKIHIIADISSQSPVTEVRVYFNGRLVQRTSQNAVTNTTFDWEFSPPSAQDQNTLEVEAVTQRGERVRDSAIVYRQ